mgnify:CR=1 FL=1
MKPYTFIEGHETVLERFGMWPSFHDGEVHRLVLDSTRRDQHGNRYASVELQLRGWIVTAEVTEHGFYRCNFDSVVSFLFENVTSVEFDGLNHQNVLSSLDLEVVQAASGTNELKVVLEHCFGLSGEFVAGSAKVLSVTPFAKPNDA